MAQDPAGDGGQPVAQGRGAGLVAVITRVDVPTLPRGGVKWVAALHELAGQLDGGLVYDRDLPALTAALEEVLAAAQARRLHQRGRHR